MSSGPVLARATRGSFAFALVLVGLARLHDASAKPIATLRATPTSASIKLDGKLDEPAWRGAFSTDAFTQKFPDEALPPSEKTTLKILYTDRAVYVGFECTQRFSKIVARLTRRDRAIESDRVTISLDTRSDLLSAFEFTVNAAGVLSDTLRYNDVSDDSDWDENWDARVARTATGWSAEIEIPMTALRFERGTQQAWGMQARRYISARQGIDEFSYIPRDNAGEVSQYGRLTHLELLRKPTPFEGRIYGIGRVFHRDATDTTTGSGWKVAGTLGGDLRWHVTSNLSLDLSVNPDFAQVEADESFLNLSTYELHYPEKRALFIEGLDIFATPNQLVYTRRIGLVPDLPVLRLDAPYGERIVDPPEATTIYGALKLTGTLGTHLGLGLLSALTGRNDVEVELASGARLHRTVSPMTLFNAVRLKYTIDTSTVVGLVATSVNRFEPVGLYPLVPAGVGTNTGPTYALCPDGSTIQGGGRCLHDAYVAAVDARWSSPSRTYVVYGQAILTGISRGPVRSFRDGTTIQSGDLGGAGNFYAAKESGSWTALVAYWGESKRADFNDLGYMPRQNAHFVSADVSYRTLTPWWRTLQTVTKLELTYNTNLAGSVFERRFRLNTEWKFKNFWSLFVELQAEPYYFDDREVGDGTALQRSTALGGEIYAYSDQRKSIAGYLGVQAQYRFFGPYVYVEGSLAFRGLSRFLLEITPTATIALHEPRYVAPGLAARELIFGQLKATAFGITVRGTYTFTPRLSLQAYAQLFVSALHYDKFTSFTPTSAHQRVYTDALSPTLETIANPDSTNIFLNVNLVLRWEFRLGSTLYFVYTHSQQPSSFVSDGRTAQLDPGLLRRAPAADVLALKLTFWWN